jgi:hypothetical protein
MIRRSALAFLAVVFAASAANAQDVTGDFKVTGISYANDVATVSGSVNHGAIQSGKSVVVDITYDYSFVAEKTETIPGETITTTVFVPGKCVTAPQDNLKACFEKDGVTPKATNGEIWTGHYEVSTVTTEPTTVTTTINPSSQGMTAITEPTVVKGRLNPKGKITGYNWEAKQSIVPTPELVNPALVPAGYTVVSVVINSISYTAYLVDANAGVIADTVTSGVLYQ